MSENIRRFRDALEEYISGKRNSEILKVDEYLLVGLYQYEHTGTKYIVCDSIRSDTGSHKYSISNRLEFTDLLAAENYYEECRAIVINSIAMQIVDAVR